VIPLHNYSPYSLLIDLTNSKHHFLLLFPLHSFIRHTRNLCFGGEPNAPLSCYVNYYHQDNSIDLHTSISHLSSSLYERHIHNLTPQLCSPIQTFHAIFTFDVVFNIYHLIPLLSQIYTTKITPPFRSHPLRVHNLYFSLTCSIITPTFTFTSLPLPFLPFPLHSCCLALQHSTCRHHMHFKIMISGL
jgi:hypothetical protein